MCALAQNPLRSGVILVQIEGSLADLAGVHETKEDGNGSCSPCSIAQADIAKVL